jgi:hypothetical protein
MKFAIMNRMRKLLLALCVPACFIDLSGQGPKFNKVVHDFGNVKEESGTVSAVFSFKNVTPHPIIIVKVETSCGCTTPQYSKDSIMPGDTGFVRAIYETRGRDGNFNKNLFVHFNIDSYYKTLNIKGNVIPEANLAKKPDEYTTTYANLAFNTTMAYFPTVFKTDKQKEYRIKVFNYMGYPIRFLNVKNKPDYVTLDLGDSIVGVEDTLTITVFVDGSKIPQMGDMTAPISFVTDDDASKVKFIYVRTFLKEDFSKLSKKELKNAPKITMDTMGPLHFGKRHSGEKFNYTIKFTNTGKTDLNVYKVVPSCSCITFSLGKQLLKPGETANLVITVDTLNQTQADLIKYLTILTNDPKHSEIKIKMTLTVIP